MKLKYSFDKSLDKPLYIQLYMCIRDDIVSGKIEDASRLPSRRSLCAATGLSKNTVELAYQKLVEDGYVISRARSGFFVRRNSPLNTNIAEPDFYNKDGIQFNLSHNGVDADSLPLEYMAKLYREIVYDEPELFGFGHKYGEKSLRQAVCKYLYEERGIECRPSQVIIGAGSDYLLEQLCKLFDEGSLVSFENPCFARSYIPVKYSRLETCLTNAVINDFNLNGFLSTGANIVYVQPEHQFPLGYVMSDKVRSVLTDWAASGPERYIIEDEHDSWFYEHTPHDSLFKTDTSGSVIYIGAFSATTVPAFKTAFMVLPDALKARLNERLPYYLPFASRVEQRVIASYIQSGKYMRHIAKLREIYNEKRNHLLSELDKHFGNDSGAKVLGGHCGKSMILNVETRLTESEMRYKAALAGVKLISVADCCIAGNELLPRNSFIIGFGELNKDEISQAVKNLAAAWADR